MQFLSTPSARRATVDGPVSVQLVEFLSTPSARRATSSTDFRWRRCNYFYPRPPRGGRPQAGQNPEEVVQFLSTPSARRATPDPAGAVVSDQFLSTPSARRATRVRFLRSSQQHNFYPRPPRGGRPGSGSCGIAGRLFLSTPSARRATCECIVDIDSTTEFLSTPSARRATFVDFCEKFGGGISIHALREEGDAAGFWLEAFSMYFYPRPPRGGRQVDGDRGRQQVVISIHALREEGDKVLVCLADCFLHFYPRPPRGGRPTAGSCPARWSDFYPRPPRGGRRRSSRSV